MINNVESETGMVKMCERLSWPKNTLVMLAEIHRLTECMVVLDSMNKKEELLLPDRRVSGLGRCQYWGRNASPPPCPCVR
jgi:hypothetical protein